MILFTHKSQHSNLFVINSLNKTLTILFLIEKMK